MKILGIESSCDDTSVAIVDSSKQILANERVSQNKIHQAYKGVVPELAARNHVFHIDRVTKKAFNSSGLNLNDIDAIAISRGTWVMYPASLLMKHGARIVIWG